MKYMNLFCKVSNVEHFLEKYMAKLRAELIACKIFSGRFIIRRGHFYCAWRRGRKIEGVYLNGLNTR